MAQTREAIIGWKVQADAVTEATLAAADFLHADDNDSDSPSATEHERDKRNGTFTKLNALRGPRRHSVSVRTELAGGTTAVAPKWGELVRGCGFAQGQLQVIPIGSITNGPFKYGELIGNAATIGAATALGLFVRLLTGPARMVYMPILGTLGASGTVYAYRSPQPSVTWSLAPANAGWGYRPQSEVTGVTPAYLTVERRINSQRRTVIGGRGGSLSLSFRHGEAVMADVRVEGAPVYTGTYPNQTWRDVSTLAVGNVGSPPPPPVVGGMGFPFLVDAYSPVASELGISVENTIASRPSIGNNDLAGTGYMAPAITDRQVTMSYDPENPPVASHDHVQRFIAGSLYASVLEAGMPGTTPGLILAGGPNFQLRGDSLPYGERDGVEIVNADGRFVGGLSGYGADDEFLLALITI